MTSIKETTSRRTLLRSALLTAGGVVVAATVMASAGEAATANKLSQKSAGYRAKPLGKSQCDNCALWLPSAACKTVEGTISPNGWCNLYNPK